LINSRANEDREPQRGAGSMQRARRARERCRLIAPLFAFSLITLGARATSAAAPALAQVLFEEGRALIAQGRTDEACAKFSESNRLDPATGTLLNLAVCNESRGKTATAWEQFRAAEAASQYDRRDDRVRFARDHIAQLEPRLSRVTLRVSSAQRVPGLSIALDGVRLEQAAWNVATPIDPGEHVVVAEAPSRVARTWVVVVRPEPSEVSVSIELEPTLAPSQGLEADAAALTPATHAADSSPSTTKVLAYASGALGAAGLIGGAVFGVQAFSRWDERNRLCPADVCATPAAQRAQRSAESAARNANIAVGVGLASLLAAGIFYMLPEPEGAAATSEPGELSASLAWDSVLSPEGVHAIVRGSW
jgi:hypothetical protein